METTAKKKVLFLITKSNWHGAQRYVYDVASNLSAEQFDVAVALGGDGPLIAKLEEATIRVIRIPGLQRDISLQKELLSSWQIATVIRAERPDILHVNSSKAGAIGACLGRLLRVPRVVFTAHAWAFNEDRSNLSRFMVGFFHWLTILCSHATITASHTLKQEMTWPFTQAKMHTIHHGRTVPTYTKREAARQEIISYVPALASYQADTWTGTIAELHPVKRHDVMIKAVAELKEHGVTVRHIIISDGELREELAALRDSLGLQEQIFFTGAILEAARLLKAFDIFTFTSRSEALGYAAIEAELPIVATRVGGIPEVITDQKEGLLVPSGDVTATTTALLRLLQAPAEAKRLAAAAKTKSEYFNINRMVTATTAIYLGQTSSINHSEA